MLQFSILNAKKAATLSFLSLLENKTSSYPTPRALAKSNFQKPCRNKSQKERHLRVFSGTRIHRSIIRRAARKIGADRSGLNMKPRTPVGRWIKGIRIGMARERKSKRAQTNPKRSVGIIEISLLIWPEASNLSKVHFRRKKAKYLLQSQHLFSSQSDMNKRTRHLPPTEPNRVLKLPYFSEPCPKGALVSCLLLQTPPPTAFEIPMAIPTAAASSPSAIMTLIVILVGLPSDAIHPHSM